MEADGATGKRRWQRSATEDLWERTLAQIETRMGRMAYLSRLRNPETDRYEHHGLMTVFGEEAAEDALRHSHEDVLMSLLGMSILDQKDDVKKYVEGLPQSKRRLLSAWEKNREYQTLLPSRASDAQRILFEANLRLIIQHLKGEFAAAEKSRK
jgi:hypothetical protein